MEKLAISIYRLFRTNIQVWSKFSSLVTSAIGAPPCLENAVIDKTIMQELVKALVDTKASENFLHSSLYKKLNIKPTGPKTFVSLASNTSKRRVKIVLW